MDNFQRNEAVWRPTADIKLGENFLAEFENSPSCHKTSITILSTQRPGFVFEVVLGLKLIYTEPFLLFL